MTTISQTSPMSMVQPNLLAPPISRLGGPAAEGDDTLRATFTQFVGETFYGQMIKAMRSTVGKAAYFHGGRAEEAFQGQLDQALAEHLTETSAKKFAEPLFRLQFPHLADETANKPAAPMDGLRQLDSLSRR